MKVLIFGVGWLGNKYKEYLKADLHPADITDKQAVAKALNEYKPKVVINAAGQTGRPNIDWCEEHKAETVEGNITGPLVLLKSCLDKNISLVHLSSGCIFNGASPKPSGFTEEDEPNPVSFYAWSKTMADNVLKKFPVLVLRLRMPIDKESNPRNLINKLAGYKKIIDVNNSVTIVDDLLLATKELINNRQTGIFNIVNPGPVRHQDILKWYKEIVDPQHNYELITIEQMEIDGLAKTGRSNCILDSSKLKNAGVHLKPAEVRIKECLREYKKHYDKARETKR